MLNRIFAGALALAIATPVFAAEAAPEKPKCECCAKKEGDAMKGDCCGDKAAPKAPAESGANDEHKGHSGH